MRNEPSKLTQLTQPSQRPQSSHPLAVLDHCTVSFFYFLVAMASVAFAATLLLPSPRADDALATAWLCIFSAALCLLTRLAVLVWEDSGEPIADETLVDPRGR